MNEQLRQPLRIGLLGLGQQGTFLFERLLTNERFHLAVAFDNDASKRAHAAGRGIPIADSLDEFLATTLDFVIVTVSVPSRAEIGNRVLTAGHDLVLATPIAGNLDDAKRFYATAEELGRRIVVWSNGREESDFRSAYATVRSGEIGRLRLLRFERWERMVFTDEGSNRSPLAPSLPIFDQLTALVDAPAESVSVHSIDSGGFTAVVTFEGGAVASITLNSAAATRFDHGWAIDGTSGGYQRGRRSVMTREEEIYDVPAEVLASTSLEEILSGDMNETSLAVSRAESLRLVTLFSAAERSFQSGRLERVEPIN